jgi:hypothetical protein
VAGYERKEKTMAKAKKGSLVRVTRATHVGTEEILGRVMMGEIEEVEGHEVMTHITVEGMILTTKIRGLPLPIEEEKPVILEMIPVEPKHPRLLKVEVLA